ncbi:hypothetical protein [Pseudomonas putida]|uniref:hypothetical protein n=1 Tax=Pseudomonas putida TaxID=303 RepID=UPI000CD406FA|nr:hypothetical protein [Pseudomonas putida]POF85728.1 hypothetical protein BGP81_25325 [Pseudomonas putida]
MPDSQHLKNFKAVWGDSCQSMWAEILSITMAESYIISNYSDIPAGQLIAERFYAPELNDRLRDLTRSTFLERVDLYKEKVITNRAVILSAVFETYFSDFLDTYIKSKPKLFDKSSDSRTDSGNKFYGTIKKERGLSNRILKFAEIAPAKIKSITPLLTYLDDIYNLRNIIAHNAGLVSTTENFSHVDFSAGSRIVLTSEKLLELAAPVVKIAEKLDEKIT